MAIETGGMTGHLLPGSVDSLDGNWRQQVISRPPIIQGAHAFADVIDAIDQLSLEEQEAVVEIVRRRVAERGRQRLIADVREARREYEAGLCRPCTVDELMDDILS